MTNYIHLTTGTTVHASNAPALIEQANLAGDAWGAFHKFVPAFADEGTAQATQAGLFLTALSSLGSKSPGLPPALMIAEPDHYSWSHLASTAIAWCQMVENETGKSAVLLTTAETAGHLQGFPFDRVSYVVTPEQLNEGRLSF